MPKQPDETRRGGQPADEPAPIGPTGLARDPGRERTETNVSIEQPFDVDLRDRVEGGVEREPERDRDGGVEWQPTD